ncbi:ureidoglycolate lyase [Aureimonas altamirensis]|uniref:ureidoglycolate lyase n=1 Tax=Aureimonas altamirensis TaxID=370622 RepID=UPI002036A31F|nr:ureidoglycolate lyase [Aureimonas altamirensis]MCM2504428.1 ureidoglycolate lyase [Aureimonas altamirensis]
MTRVVTARPLTRAAFAPYGDVLDTDWANHYPINAGRCERFHELARVDVIGEDARAILSIFRGTPYTMPLTLTLVERHPLGSQAFMPLDGRPFLVVVCPDEGGRPGRPEAFLTAPGQGVNYHRNVWHGVLTPLQKPQNFIVADRGGSGNNLEEFTLDEPFTIELPEGTQNEQ